MNVLTTRLAGKVPTSLVTPPKTDRGKRTCAMLAHDSRQGKTHQEVFEEAAILIMTREETAFASLVLSAVAKAPFGTKGLGLFRLPSRLDGNLAIFILRLPSGEELPRAGVGLGLLGLWLLGYNRGLFGFPRGHPTPSPGVRGPPSKEVGVQEGCKGPAHLTLGAAPCRGQGRLSITLAVEFIT